MGQTTSKKQKKNKLKNGELSRTSKERQSSRKIKNPSAVSNTTETFIKNEIKSSENQVKDTNVNRVQEESKSRDVAKVNNTEKDSSCKKENENGNWHPMILNGNIVPPQYLVSSENETNPSENQEEHPVHLDKGVNEINEIQELKGSNLSLPERTISETGKLYEQNKDGEIEVNNNSDTEVVQRPQNTFRTEVIVNTRNHSSLVRSASDADKVNADVELRHAPPVRRLSVRESTEFKRKQFYQQMLSNESHFEANNRQYSRLSLDGALPSKQQLDKLRAFYVYKSEIKDYEVEEYPEQLRKYAEELDDIESKIKEMTDSQLHLYFPTLKDELHNKWKDVFAKRVSDNSKKVQLISRIKTDLDVLNNKFLKRKLLFIKQ